MSHEVETLAYSGEVPWHGLGTKVAPDISPAEILKVSGLDWQVETRPLYFKNKDGELVESDRRALVRDKDEKYLSAVGKNWKPTQNEEALSFFVEFTEKGGMTMETAGSLKDGKHVFALGKYSREFEVVKNDPIQGYLLFHNPHIFGKSIEVMETSIRVVCNNTLTAALGNYGKSAGSRYSVTHRSDFDAEEAKQMIGLAEESLVEYEKAAKFLVKKKTKEEDLEVYFNQVFPGTGKKEVSRNASMAKAALEYQPGVDIKGVAGTWWNAFNAVTYVADHHLGRSQDTRVANAWFGGTRNKKLEAFDLAVKMAEAA